MDHKVRLGPQQNLVVRVENADPSLFSHPIFEVGSEESRLAFECLRVSDSHSLWVCVSYSGH